MREAKAKIFARTTGGKAAGCAKELAALLFLCPRSLTLMAEKGYVGGLGAIGV
jgi:hypothetical protein